jgi:3-methyladenine DNA glycosylase AlkD
MATAGRSRNDRPTDVAAAAHTARAFVERLDALRSPEELVKYQRYFKTGPGDYAEGDAFMGVRMGSVFELAKEFADMAPAEIETLLDEPFHEPRAGAVRIMATQARAKRTPEARRQELYELYLRRHDRIDNWDLVDLGAWDVVGRWLVDRPRDVLYRLARSANMWERRTAILATMAFIRHGDIDDTLVVAKILLADDEDLIRKATGWALRAAGDVDRARVRAFLDEHAATMPRTALRYALEHFDQGERAHYMGLTKVATP